MLWDSPEANLFSTSTQNWMSQIEWVTKTVENLPIILKILILTMESILCPTQLPPMSYNTTQTESPSLHTQGDPATNYFP